MVQCELEQSQSIEWGENVKDIAGNKTISNIKCVSTEQQNNAFNLTVLKSEKCAETLSDQDVNEKNNDASKLDTYKYTNGSAKVNQEKEHVTEKHSLEMNDASVNKSTIAVPSIIHGFHYPGVYRLHRRITPLHKRNGTEMTKTTATNEQSSMPPTSTPKCEKLTSDQKYAKLESVGGRNQQFMANSPEEAGRNFPRLIDTSDTFSQRNVAFDEAPNFADMDDLEFDDELNENASVYMLNDDCFPIFLNSVICDEYDTQCIFDRFTAQGKCQTKTLSFKVMRNKGDKECEDWVFEYLDVPVACECYLSKSSWLEAMHAPHESR
ncbi:hypothetical protein Ddc_08903 [Ditylenchus destructor]|nr:hypothetical protein Ddc_08903 [Ditylenchus destructor]